VQSKHTRLETCWWTIINLHHHPRFLFGRRR